MNEPESLPDADLVALVHGELDADAERAVRARLAHDPEARSRHEALAAADAALREALDTPAAPARGARHDWLRPLLAAAAVCVVAAVLVFQRRAVDEATGRNEFVELKVAPRGGASHPLFTEVELELRWKSLRDDADWPRMQVTPFGFGDTPAVLAATIAKSEVYGKFMPVVVAANLHAPDGTVIPARLRPQRRDAPERPDGWIVVAGSKDVVQVVTLRDFEVQVATPPPYLGGRPGDGVWVEDFLWAYRNVPRGQQPRWFPEQPGEWRIELRVESLPPPQPGAWPTFQAPLTVTTAVVLTAEVSPWSEAHDGLQARLVQATGGSDLDHTPIAVQLRNQSGRARRYNVTGSTIAKIPQPFHFDLVVDGEDWQQRSGLGVITAAVDEMLPHADGTVRTLVVMPDYWRRDGTALGLHPGRHQIEMRFHFEPSVWVAGDKELWMGKLLTPPLPIDVPKRD